VRADGGAPESAIADQEGERREDLRGIVEFCACDSSAPLTANRGDFG